MVEQSFSLFVRLLVGAGGRGRKRCHGKRQEKTYFSLTSEKGKSKIHGERVEQNTSSIDDGEGCERLSPHNGLLLLRVAVLRVLRPDLRHRLVSRPASDDDVRMLLGADAAEVHRAADDAPAVHHRGDDDDDQDNAYDDHIGTRGYVVHVETVDDVQSLYWNEHDKFDTHVDDPEHQ